MNLDVGTASPINGAILPLLDKAQSGEDANRLSQKPGKDVLGEHNLDPKGKQEEAKEKGSLLETFAARPARRKVDGSYYLRNH